MVAPRLFLACALGAVVSLSSASVFACPTRGGEAAVPDDSQAEALLKQASVLDQSAMHAERDAEAERRSARRQRQLAASFREQSKMNSDVDRDVLLAKAVLADKEATAADSRASSHTKRAKTLRTRAAKLRATAKKMMGGGTMRAI